MHAFPRQPCFSKPRENKRIEIKQDDSSGYSYSQTFSDDDNDSVSDNLLPESAFGSEREHKEYLLFKNEFVFENGEWHFNDSERYKQLQAELEALITEEESDLDSLADNLQSVSARPPTKCP